MNKRKSLLLVFIGLFAYVSLPIMAEEFVEFGKRTQAFYANRAGNYEDLAVIRLEYGKFVVITVKQSGEERN